jgi:hypothetical protein
MIIFPALKREVLPGRDRREPYCTPAYIDSITLGIDCYTSCSSSACHSSTVLGTRSRVPLLHKIIQASEFLSLSGMDGKDGMMRGGKTFWDFREGKSSVTTLRVDNSYLILSYLHTCCL